MKVHAWLTSFVAVSNLRPVNPKLFFSRNSTELALFSPPPPFPSLPPPGFSSSLPRLAFPGLSCSCPLPPLQRQSFPSLLHPPTPRALPCRSVGSDKSAMAAVTAPTPKLDRYIVIHVATTCDEHGVYVTKDSAEVIELGWMLLDTKTCEEVHTIPDPIPIPQRLPTPYRCSPPKCLDSKLPSTQTKTKEEIEQENTQCSKDKKKRLTICFNSLVAP